MMFLLFVVVCYYAFGIFVTCGETRKLVKRQFLVLKRTPSYSIFLQYLYEAEGIFRATCLVWAKTNSPFLEDSHILVSVAVSAAVAVFVSLWLEPTFMSLVVIGVTH